MISFSVW